MQLHPIGTARLDFFFVTLDYVTCILSLRNQFCSILELLVLREVVLFFVPWLQHLAFAYVGFWVCKSLEDFLCPYQLKMSIKPRRLLGAAVSIVNEAQPS